MWFRRLDGSIAQHVSQAFRAWKHFAHCHALTHMPCVCVCVCGSEWRASVLNQMHNNFSITCLQIFSSGFSPFISPNPIFTASNIASHSMPRLRRHVVVCLASFASRHLSRMWRRICDRRPAYCGFRASRSPVLSRNRINRLSARLRSTIGECMVNWRATHRPAPTKAKGKSDNATI